MNISIGEQYYIAPDNLEKLNNDLDRVMNPRPYQDIINVNYISGEKALTICDYLDFQKAAMDQFLIDLKDALILDEIPL